VLARGQAAKALLIYLSQGAHLLFMGYGNLILLPRALYEQLSSTPGLHVPDRNMGRCDAAQHTQHIQLHNVSGLNRVDTVTSGTVAA